jgi:carboxypeptidase T
MNQDYNLIDLSLIKERKIMKKTLILVLLFIGTAIAQNSIVRVYAPSLDDLTRISAKLDLDIAAARPGSSYDIVADAPLIAKIIGSGLNYEVVVHDLAVAKESVRADYLSYAEIEDSLRQLAQDYPALCKFDSLPIPTYEGNWIYGIKISDNPHIEEDDEPGFLIDGTHHSREWACIPVVIFFADSMLSAYNVDPEITAIINNTEIYLFPVINVDGYLYDYPAGVSWRKNREPFAGEIGTDPNRNYPGCSPDIAGDWGAVDEYQASHRPDHTLFCGAYANSGDETRALTLYAKEHIINAYMSYHSYSELVMWPWGWTAEETPDSALHDQVGNYMADQVQSLYGGTYGRGPIYSAIYAVSGSSCDWFYSWSHWVGGRSHLSFTTELGTMFYQSVSQLDHIVHQNFKALKYLAGFCDSIVLLLDAKVPPPVMCPIGAVGTDYTVAWHPVNADDNHPNYWELLELGNPSVIEDDLEAGTDRWQIEGFTLSTAQAHSGTHSYFSGSIDDMNHAVRTAHPYPVQVDDSVTFWCWYDLETNYDVAVAEVSENTREWFNLDTTRFNGSSSGWVRRAYSLEDWVGKSVYIRFRAMTDPSVLNQGFYVDDIYPVCLFTDIETVSSSIADTLYNFTGHESGDFYYMARGNNAAWGWGEYSYLTRASVGLGTAEGEISGPKTFTPSISLLQNPFVDRLQISYTLGDVDPSAAYLKIYDATGRLVKDLSSQLSVMDHPSSVIWDGRDESGKNLPSGVYFVQFVAGMFKGVGKAVVLK